MKRSKHSTKRRQRGVAIVEFTILAPLVLFLVLAVTEIGRAFMQYNTLTRAVRDGSRYIARTAIQGSTQTNIDITGPKLTATRNLVVYGNIAGTGTPVLPGLAPGNVAVADAGGLRVSVAATYAYQPMFAGGIPNFVLGGSINNAFTMRAEVQMRAL